jgi:molecular chaperone GrpE
MDDRKDEQPATPDEVGLEPESVEALRAQLARVKDEAERNWQQFLHAAADLENYKKQAARQRDEAVQRTRTSLLYIVLDVVDNLERALGHAPDARGNAIVDGIRMAHRQVLDMLAGMGVRPMDAAGKPFDPRYHEAVDTVPAAAAGTDPGTVVADVQKGYLLNGEVLRPAKVRVAK